MRLAIMALAIAAAACSLPSPPVVSAPLVLTRCARTDLTGIATAYCDEALCVSDTLTCKPGNDCACALAREN